MSKIEILGTNIDNVDLAQTLKIVDDLVKEGRGGKYKFAVKPNAEIVTYSNKNLNFQKILNSAHLATPDGIGLIVASKLTRNPLKGRVGGPDLTLAILKQSEARGYKVFFYGGKSDMLEKLQKALKNKFPKLIVVGFHHGYDQDESSVVQQILNVKPDILFVGLGFPKQEEWIYHNLNNLKVPLSIAEGGSFDFISGDIPRAPVWVRKTGFEWLFRLLLQPWRIKRQLVLPIFIFLLFQDLFKNK